MRLIFAVFFICLASIISLEAAETTNPATPTSGTHAKITATQTSTKASPTKTTATQTKTTATPSKTTTPAKKPITPAKKPGTPVKKAGTPASKPGTTATKPGTPVKKQATTTKTPATTTKKPVRKDQGQVSALKKKLANGKKDESLEALIEDLEEIKRKRDRLRLMVGGYSFAHMALYLTKYVSIVNPYFRTFVQGLDSLKNRLLAPLDKMFNEHQKKYRELIERYIRKNPKYAKRKGRLPKVLKLKSHDGKDFELKVPIRTIDEKVSEKSLHISDKSGLDLLTTAVQMR